LSRSVRQGGDVDLPSNSPKRELEKQPADRSKPSPVSPCAPCGESVKPEAEFTARAHRVKSNIRKILLTSPTFPRLYADVVLHYAPNSSEAKILRPHYQKICKKVNGRQCGDSRPRLSRSRSDRAHCRSKQRCSARAWFSATAQFQAGPAARRTPIRDHSIHPQAPQMRNASSERAQECSPCHKA